MQVPDSSAPISQAQDIADTTASRLLKTAARLFREKGYANSTTRELAMRLGIQKASLYYHISGKEDLLYALCIDSLQRIRQEVEQALTQETQPLKRVQALIRAHLLAALSDQDKHATMLIELRELSGERRAEVLRLRDAYEELVRQTIAEAQLAGLLRNDLPAKYQALALLNLLNWTIFWFRGDGELTPDDLAAMFTTLFLSGAALQAPDSRTRETQGP